MTNEELAAEYQNGNKKAFDELLEANTGIIHSMIGKWFNLTSDGYISKDDLEQECVIGFFYAVKEYKSDIECTFSTFAFNRIQWHLIRVFKKSTYKTASNEMVSFIRIDEPIPGTENFTISNTLEDEAVEEEFERLFDKLDQKSLQSGLMQLLDAVLSTKEKDVLLKRYGVGCQPMSQIEISQIYKVSNSRIGQIENEAMRKLKKSALTDYFADKYMQSKRKIQKKEKMNMAERNSASAIKNNRMGIEEALNFFSL